MEIANPWAWASDIAEKVRVASRADAAAITDLLRKAPYSHLHVDWHYPADWLGLPGFVVLEETSTAAAPPRTFTSALFASRRRLLACLAATADPPPAAWVRIAALQSSLDPLETLAAFLARVVPVLRETAVTQLAWMPVNHWPAEWLEALGFRQINAIETYVKRDLTLPTEREAPPVIIRAAHERNLAALAAIEKQAFDPLWWHSETALRLAKRQAFSFDVVELAGEVVGFQFSTRSRSGVHLSRMTIAPRHQRSGIGSTLLAHTIRSYARQGFRMVTLNTQVDNLPSQRLYRRFGFVASGERYPVWSIDV